MSEQPHRQLEKLAKKHNLRQARWRIDGELKTWLEHNQVPEGFELELPPPFQVFTSTVDGKRLTVSSPLAPIGRHPPDELHERQQRAEERIAQEFGDNAVQVRGWKTSVEIEMERLQSTLDESCRGARAAMNAWMFLVLESLPEANASGKSSLEKYMGDMMRLRSQYRQDTDRYPGKTYVLNSLSEKYSARQMLRFESIIFWGHLVRPLTAEALRGEFSKLCTFFNVELLIEETTLDGLLYYRQKIDDQVEELLPLECQRSACEVQHTVIVRKGVIVRRGAPYEKDWNEKEWADAAEAAFTGAPTRLEDCRWLVDRFHAACDNDHPPKTMTDLKRELEPDAGKVMKNAREAFSAAGISAGDGYEARNPVSFVSTVEELLNHYKD